MKKLLLTLAVGLLPALSAYAACTPGLEYCDSPLPPLPPSLPLAEEVVNFPSLENFTLQSSEFEDNYIYLVFAPNGTELFNLHVELRFDNGQDILSTWCTGDEAICKAVGNGQACGDGDHTGADAWCYLAE
ncbi:MAG: hypothetical protein II913_01750 [Elusimicrobiaceae bacterium]|nr:hypothetical protein [Elusimicrobiaceae bacterium]